MAAWPENLFLSRRAARDLDDLPDADARRILDDLARLARGTFPGEVKPIPTLPQRPLQADAGRFRILFRRSRTDVEVIAIFPKGSQAKVFRGLR